MYRAPATLVQRATAGLGERGGCARAELRTPTLIPPSNPQTPRALPYPPPLLSPLLPAMVAARKQGGEEGPCALLSPWREGDKG
eukprot:scaffold15005_cov112-Isochrysis_galbana.AAC.4